MRTILFAALVAYLVLSFLVYKKLLKVSYPNGGATISEKAKILGGVLASPFLMLYSKLKG